MRYRRTKNDQTGMALVIVLWMMALLTLLAAGFSRMTRTEIVVVSQQAEQARVRAMAEAGVWLAIHDLLSVEVDRDWVCDGREYVLPWHDGALRLRLQDEAGRIDLNTARAELLQGLLLSSVVDETTANNLLQSIMDWRDRDSERRIAGAEDDDYRRSGLAYDAKDGPFNGVAELRRVMGMNDEIFTAVEPALTVYSHQPGINPALAPPAALLAIPGMNEDRVAKLIADRENGIAAPMPFVAEADARFLTQIRDQVVRVSSMGTLGENQVTLDVTVLLHRNQTDPISILAWQER
ncbi:MAG TPA: hypothetical protein VJN91_08150 [Gammaproteobacteria bacterium]|nr:hypothetical protein [Gammaproteobacteria bacterium]